MNSSAAGAGIEPGWRTYLRGAAFSIPALSILAFVRVFLLPKLETIWRDAGFGVPSAITAVHVTYFVTEHFVVIAAAVIGIVVVLEWRSSRWPRYRGAFVGVAAFLANTAILVFITAMLMTALLAAPALLRMK